MNGKDLIEILAAAGGTLGYSLLFQIPRRCLFPSVLGGALSWGAFLLFFRAIGNEWLCYLLSSVLVSLFAFSLAPIMKTPVTVLFVPAIIPLIPGGGLYNAILYGVTGDWYHFGETGVHTLALAASLAIGMMAVSTLFTLTRRLFRRLCPRKKPAMPRP